MCIRTILNACWLPFRGVDVAQCAYKRVTEDKIGDSVNPELSAAELSVKTMTFTDAYDMVDKHVWGKLYDRQILRGEYFVENVEMLEDVVYTSKILPRRLG